MSKIENEIEVGDSIVWRSSTTGRLQTAEIVKITNTQKDTAAQYWGYFNSNVSLQFVTENSIEKVIPKFLVFCSDCDNEVRTKEIDYLCKDCRADSGNRSKG